jgi:PHS family inorganic phosphate transporter-like MFS transporter
VRSLVRSPLQEQYPVKGSFDTSWQKTYITASTLIGAVVGQLVLGALADRLGRRRLFFISGGLTFLGSLACACAFNFGSDNEGIWAWLVVWRFVLGVGVGGEYPLSAAHTSEHAGSTSSGTRLCVVFSFTMIGSVLSSGLIFVCRAAGMPPHVIWRFAFAFGALLSAVTFRLRWSHAFDSAQFVKAREEAAAVAAGSPETASAPKLPLGPTLRAYWKPLLGTAGCWGLYDVVNYGLGLYSSDLVSGMANSLGGGDKGSAAAVLISNLFSLPGGLLAATVLPRLGRKFTMQAGTLSMLICFVVLASGWTRLSQPLLLLVYCVQSLFSRAGPGAISYVMPGEVFPVRVRATCHGIAAASGKIGAVLGTLAYAQLLALHAPDNPHRAAADYADYAAANHDYAIRVTCAVSAALCVVLLVHAQVFLPNYSVKQLEQLEQAPDDGAALRVLYSSGRL